MANDLNELVGKAELNQIFQVSSVTWRAPSLSPDVKNVAKYMSNELSGAPEFDEENNILIGQIRCRIWVAPEVTDDAAEDDSFSSAKMGIEAVYALIFEVEPFSELDVNCLTAFMKTIGRMTVWPYFRSFCAIVANEALMDLPPLPLKKAKFPISNVDYKELD
ncbi:hypothetical protein [Ponticaulis koreensis]|uniref:hypothetical protein n=1 Tax=Ponticaulis koreensis TaxID=1123045 RepID=UPI0003B51544|nr:hypothetical protein [Ponticaulis koreensis]